jgi:hypothetical protein
MWFLEGLKGHGRDVLIESVKQGFGVCFESTSNPYEIYDSGFEFIETSSYGATVSYYLYCSFPEDLENYPTIKKLVDEKTSINPKLDIQNDLAIKITGEYYYQSGGEEQLVDKEEYKNTKLYISSGPDGHLSGGINITEDMPEFGFLQTVFYDLFLEIDNKWKNR